MPMIFFFKQKTAYEIGSGLVGSEMCIRDRGRIAQFVRSDFATVPTQAWDEQWSLVTATLVKAVPEGS